MADNYLEKRREEYEKRKAEWLKKKRNHPTVHLKMKDEEE